MFLQLKLRTKKRADSTLDVATSAPAPEKDAKALAVLERRAAPPSGPFIRTYVVDSVPQAMTMARRDLGEDSTLIETKRLTTPEGRTRFEVTFGVLPAAKTTDAPPRPNLDPPSRTTAPVANREGQAVDPVVAATLIALQHDVARIQAMMTRSLPGAPADESLPQDPIPSILLKNGMDPELVAALEKQTPKSLRRSEGAGSTESDRQRLGDYLRPRIKTSSVLSAVADLTGPIMFVGPPASGQTTAVVKLAVEYGVRRGRRVQIYSLDGVRPSANLLLNDVANLLDISYQSMATPDALSSALARPQPRGSIVLVDASGFGESVERDAEFVDLRAAVPSAELHLVLSAAWHPRVIKRAVDRFEVLCPDRLMFTMIDQSAAFGSILQEAVRTGKPLSFLGSGSRRSGTIEIASVDRILELMWEAAGPPQAADRMAG